MVVVGFDFDRGGGTSIGPAGLGTQTAATGPGNGWEAFFLQGGHPRYYVDLRNPWSKEAAAYVTQRRALWTIGSLWDPNAIATKHRWSIAAGNAFDVMIYIETMTASRLRR